MPYNFNPFIGNLDETKAHDLLSAYHTDALTGTVVRGDLVIGNATPKWSRLAKGAANAIFGSDGTDIAWETATGTGSPVRANSPTFVTLVDIGAPDGSGPTARLTAYGGGTTVFPSITMRQASNTLASPSATINNAVLGRFVGQGYGTTGFANGIRFDFKAAEQWTDTAQGSYLTISTHSVGDNTLVERFRINPSGGVISTIVQPAGLSVTELVGYDVVLTNAGTATNTYGIRVLDVTSGTQTNQAYGIAIQDLNCRNLFEGTKADFYFDSLTTGGLVTLTTANTGANGSGNHQTAAKIFAGVDTTGTPSYYGNPVIHGYFLNNGASPTTVHLGDMGWEGTYNLSAVIGATSHWYLWDGINSRTMLEHAFSAFSALNIKDSGFSVVGLADTSIAYSTAFPLTKNTSTTQTFFSGLFKPTFNTGASNANTTVNVVGIDTVNTSVIGLTVNLLNIAYGGASRLLLTSAGLLTLAGGLTISGGAVTLTAASSLLVPSSAGYAATADASLGYDTTQDAFVAGGNGAIKGFIPRTLASLTGSSDTITASVVNTTPTLFATNFAIPASFIGTSKTLRVTMFFSTTCTASPTLILRCKLGTIAVYTSPTVAPGNFTRGGGLQVCIQGTAAPGASVNTVTGVITSTIWSNAGHGNTVAQPVAIATNAGQTLQWEAEWSANTANNSVTLLSMLVEEMY